MLLIKKLVALTSLLIAVGGFGLMSSPSPVSAASMKPDCLTVGWTTVAQSTDAHLSNLHITSTLQYRETCDYVSWQAASSVWNESGSTVTAYTDLQFSINNYGQNPVDHWVNSPAYSEGGIQLFYSTPSGTSNCAYAATIIKNSGGSIIAQAGGNIVCME